MALQKILIDWFSIYARQLPWREASCTPWGILVSEIMLQQTPVKRVLPVWKKWMEYWPTPDQCALASVAEILKTWDRLGYPRRALRLQEAARTISAQGHVPATYAELIKLPGIGDYTASAVSSFAFGNYEVVVDTNIRRVQARLITGKALPEPTLNAAEKAVAASLVPKNPKKSVAWNAAVMELGALICTARNPTCHACPVFDQCAWIKAGKPEPHYTPQGQKWHGTDRQVRGAIMAILRAATIHIPREALTAETIQNNLSCELSNEALKKLAHIKAPVAQRQKALSTLLADKLLVEEKAGIRLP